MSLEDELELQRKKAWESRTPRERAVRAGAIVSVERTGLALGAVGLGDDAPDFELPDVHGRPVSLSGLLAAGPAVVSFYRGGWCPYCNLELRALQARLPEIRDLGASLVAISPESPDRSLTNRERHGIEFTVLSDHGNKVARAFRIVHEIDPEVVAYQRRNGNDVAGYNSTALAEVPLPATYVIGRDGVVRFAFVSADYTARAEPEDVVSAVRALTTG